ncbi:hypothetical protein [Bacillus subtilis]|uniref:hypothetical protein n=1 Tax=Bacillus subtilis TaxID=1423 RepID=UPI002AA9F3DA|nr:hypothetical protein [Bacillus subtilis]MDY7215140.1 hypothetical protein [Bacillus subtilis]
MKKSQLFILAFKEKIADLLARLKIIKRPPCIVCEDKQGELALDNGEWICDSCSQFRG